MVAKNEKEEKTSNRFLLIWYTNIDTLTQDKLHEITWRMNQEKCKPDVIALVEGKPKNFRAEWNPVWHKNQYYIIESINMNPSDQGRGFLVQNNENIDYSLNTNNSSFCENLFLKIKIGRNIIILGVLYRSPHSTEENNHQLKNLIANLNETQSNDSILIVRDTNLPQIDWEAMSTLKDENSTEFNFIEAIKYALLTQHIKEPTRLTGRDKASLLDVVMSDIVLEDLDITLEAPIGKSDHVLVKIDVPVNKIKSKCKNRRNYEKGDYHGMRNHLADPTVQLNTWEKQKNCMKELVEKFVPLIKIRNSGNQMPLARAVCMKIKEKKAWKTFKIYQTAENLTKHKIKQNENRSATQSEALTREKEIS